MYPSEYLYSKDHEWIRVDGDTGTVGITDYAQKELGDVVYVDLPAAGKSVGAHQTLGSVESVKAVSDIFSPVSGEVIEVNQAVIDDPETINQDPHGKAWLVRIRLKDQGELAALMKGDAYQSYIATAKGH